MKTLKAIFFFSLITLFFACEKEAEIVEPSTEVEVTYRFVTRGEPQLDEVRFRDENNQVQTVLSPPIDWEYTMTVQQGFVGRLELDGSLPESDEEVRHSINIVINGSGYGCWSSGFLNTNPGPFSIETEYQMGGE